MDKHTKQEITKPVRVSLMPPPPYCRKGSKTGGDSARKAVSQLKLDVSDAGELLQLWEKLNDCSTCTLEAKINKYVSSFYLIQNT